MKKPHALTVDISEPCQQSWADMITAANGRFCAHCAKEVVDFSHMSDAALLAYVQAHGLGCGRFQQSQLSRIIRTKSARPKFWPQLMVSLGLFFGIHKVQAQAVNKPAVEVVPTAPADLSSLAVNGNTAGDLLCIFGKLTDTLGNPLVNGGVKVIDAKTGNFIGGAVTDFDGEYVIKPLDDQFVSLTVLVTFTSSGASATREIALNKINNMLNCRLNTSFDIHNLMAVGGMSFRHYTRWQLTKRRIRHFLGIKHH